MDLITFIKIIILVVLIGSLVLSAVFSTKLDILESRVDYLETILRVIQKGEKHDNNNTGRGV